MRRNQSKARFWIVLGTINLLALAYPISLFADPNQDGALLATITLLGVAVVLAIADLISVALAYSMSY